MISGWECSRRKSVLKKRKRLAQPLRGVSRFCRQDKLQSGAKMPEISKKISRKWGEKTHFRLIFGRNDRIRTCDIVVPNHARYQLRYIPVLFSIAKKGKNVKCKSRISAVEREILRFFLSTGGPPFFRKISTQKDQGQKCEP